MSRSDIPFAQPRMNPDERPATPLPVPMVVASEDDGGMARSVFLLARFLPEHGIAPHVLVHRESPLTESLRSHDLPFTVLPDLIETGLRGPRPDDRGWRAALINARRAPAAVKQLRAQCRQLGARVLYSHGTWSNYLAAAAGFRSRTFSVVWHIRNDHSKPALRFAGRALANSAGVRTVLAVSEATAAPYAGVRARVAVVYNGVDLTRGADLDPGALRRQLNASDDSVLIGFAGRLAAHKGIGVLAEAFRAMSARVPQAHLVVLGGSSRHARVDEVAVLRSQAEAWGLRDRIHTLGFIADVEPLLRSLDLTCVPSTCEDACPRTAIESLAYGVPLVASRVGGIPELVRHGETGLLVSAGSTSELATALETMASDGVRRSRMAKAAAADARERFDARETARRVAAELRAAAAARS